MTSLGLFHRGNRQVFLWSYHSVEENWEGILEGKTGPSPLGFVANCHVPLPKIRENGVAMKVIREKNTPHAYAKPKIT